nr:hypothetical protein [Hymenobacter siberiensis]
MRQSIWAQPVQHVRQARNRVTDPVSSGQPVGNGPAVGVQLLAQFPAQARQLGAGEQAPIARLLGPQVARQAVQLVGLSVAVHAAHVHP